MLPINDIKQQPLPNNDKGAFWRLSSEPKITQPQSTFSLQNNVVFPKTPQHHLNHLNGGGVLRTSSEVIRPSLFPSHQQQAASLQAQLAYIKMAAELFAGNNAAAATGNLVAGQLMQRQVHPSQAALRLAAMNPMMGASPRASHLWPSASGRSSYPLSMANTVGSSLQS